MKLNYKDEDLSTEGRFISYINSLNEEIMRRNASESHDKQKLYNLGYLLRRYRLIMARNKRAIFMAENKCLQCVYYQRLNRKCFANCKCHLD